MLKLDKEQVVAYVQIAMLLSHVSCAAHFCHRVLDLISTARGKNQIPNKDSMDAKKKKVSPVRRCLRVKVSTGCSRHQPRVMRLS